jgi:hypothetical protein
MITLEQKIIPQLLPDSQRKAEEAIKLMQSQGSFFATHANVILIL